MAYTQAHAHGSMPQVLCTCTTILTPELPPNGYSGRMCQEKPCRGMVKKCVGNAGDHTL